MAKNELFERIKEAMEKDITNVYIVFDEEEIKPRYMDLKMFATSALSYISRMGFREDFEVRYNTKFKVAVVRNKNSNRKHYLDRIGRPYSSRIRAAVKEFVDSGEQKREIDFREIGFCSLNSCTESFRTKKNNGEFFGVNMFQKDGRIFLAKDNISR